MSIKIKICGLTNKEDATWAINYGADYLGVNFWKDSPRYVSLATASKWVPQLPPFATVFGVFVNAEQSDVVKTVDTLKLKGVQLHGDEPASYVAALRIALEGLGRPIQIIKAIRMQDESNLSSLDEYKDVVDTFLLDAYVQDQPGGTGTQFSWDLAVKAKDLGKPIILAGGLNPTNVRDAVKKVAPFGVDVASGVEKSPKRKDPDKIRDFINTARK